MKKFCVLKKIVTAILLSSALCFTAFCTVNVAALDINVYKEDNLNDLLNEKVEYLSDGCSIVTQVFSQQILPVNQSLPLASSYTKTGSKKISYKDSNGTVLWTYMVNGTFTVNPGVSASCTKVSCSPSIYDSSWSVSSNTPSHSGNTATGVIVMNKKAAGTVVKTVSRTVTVKCDANGVIT